MFMLSLVSSDKINWDRAVFAFLIIHLLVYPAVNGYNTFYDRDEESIGGIKNPPPVTDDLIWVVLFMDFVAVIASCYIDWIFGSGILIFVMASKAYSCNRIRLKRFPVLSWLMVGTGQGGLMVLLVYGFVSSAGYSLPFSPKVMIVSALTACFMMASYPMTQIYQHSEDGRRGDRTLSIVLGVRGTFIFTSIFFALVLAGFALYFFHFEGLRITILYVISQIPGILYFRRWMNKTGKNIAMANYENTMKLNIVSSTAWNLLCTIILVSKYSGLKGTV
jgi:1,4-dihydroxy-2-naphthoate octaprenyltransferase